MPAAEYVLLAIISNTSCLSVPTLVTITFHSSCNCSVTLHYIEYLKFSGNCCLDYSYNENYDATWNIILHIIFSPQQNVQCLDHLELVLQVVFRFVKECGYPWYIERPVYWEANGEKKHPCHQFSPAIPPKWEYFTLSHYLAAIQLHSSGLHLILNINGVKTKRTLLQLNLYLYYLLWHCIKTISYGPFEDICNNMLHWGDHHLPPMNDLRAITCNLLMWAGTI